MNHKAQAALEYLMTYGWALVIIVTVASVLFVVFAPPQTTKFVCQSSDPTKIVLVSYTLPYDSYASGRLSSGGTQQGSPTEAGVWGHLGEVSGAQIGAGLQGEMVLQNGTGGPITITYSNPFYLISYTTSSFLDYKTGSCDPSKKQQKFFGAQEINSVTVNNTPDGGVAVEVPSGGKIFATKFNLIYITENCNLETSRIPATHSWQLKYKDYRGYPQDVNITCFGWPQR